MKRIAIVAAALNGVIGKDGAMPWRLRDDLKLFKKQTMGAPLLMGRKTFESLPGILPGRPHIVLTGQKDYARELIAVGKPLFVAHSIEEALDIASALSSNRLFVIGGGELYRQMFERELIDELMLSLVQAAPEGDTFFPLHATEGWQLVEERFFDADEHNDYPFTWQHWRKPSFT
jgi:dihydrofolate reductase